MTSTDIIHLIMHFFPVYLSHDCFRKKIPPSEKCPSCIQFLILPFALTSGTDDKHHKSDGASSCNLDTPWTTHI